MERDFQEETDSKLNDKSIHEDDGINESEEPGKGNNSTGENSPESGSSNAVDSNANQDPDTGIQYKRCLCCGNFFEASVDNQEAVFCRENCCVDYIRCVVCGKYTEKMSHMEESTFVCSEECAEKYEFNAKIKKLIHLNPPEDS